MANTNRPGPLSRWRLEQICGVIRAGGVIAYPTEAVWGLGCDPWNADAVERLLALKQRPQHKGLILVASSPKQIDYLLDPLADELRQQALQYWPGPVTCLLPDPLGLVPGLVRGAHSSIAVRISAHPVVRALCDAAGHPLVSTSCNPGARAPARQPWQVQRYFRDQLDLVVPGPLGGEQNPSRILDIVTGSWLR